MWRRLELALGTLITTFKGVNASYKKFMDKKDADHQKAERKAKDIQDKQKLSEQKQELDTRAKRLATSGATLPPFFKLDRALFQALPEKSLDSKEFDPHVACIFPQANVKEMLEEYLAKPIVQTVLTGFGGRYKRLEGFKEEGKVSSTLMVKQGKEERSSSSRR